MNKTIQFTALIALSSVATAQSQSAAIDMTKRMVEAPIKSGEWERDSKHPTRREVAPGLVAWHSDFAAAKRAATASGKPVLLFQLLGDLDQEFC